jgi:hypothetical protein
VRHSNSHMTKLGMVENEILKKKLNEIDKCIETPVMMCGMTGFQDYREMAQSLFQILALLEIENEERVNTEELMV